MSVLRKTFEIVYAVALTFDLTQPKCSLQRDEKHIFLYKLAKRVLFLGLKKIKDNNDNLNKCKTFLAKLAGEREVQKEKGGVKFESVKKRVLLIYWQKIAQKRVFPSSFSRWRCLIYA
jgi:hypothetical protein